MEFLMVSIVAIVAIISISIVTMKAIRMILSSNINLSKNIKQE